MNGIEFPFKLIVSGEEYSGWKSMRLTRGLERACADFDLSVSERWEFDWQIQPGESCEILFEDETVLTGWVDAYRPSYDASSHDVQISGRSKTCDFVDSAVMHQDGEFKGMTVGQIAQLLAQDFDLEVVIEKDGEPEKEVQISQGETCFALVERLSRLQEILVTDDPMGRLVLCRAGSGRTDTALVQGDNILAASAELDDARRHSEYVVKAQRPGTATNDDSDPDDGWIPTPLAQAYRDLRHIPNVCERFRRRMEIQRAGGGKKTRPKTLTQVRGSVRDEGITRHRPHLIVAEKQADDAEAIKRADWEMRRRIANAMRATITVQGWRQDDGRLWLTNEMVYIDSPWLALDRELIIAEVTYTYDAEGTKTELQLTHPDAFLAEPKRKGKESTTGGGKGKKGKGGGEGSDPWANWKPTA